MPIECDTRRSSMWSRARVRGGRDTHSGVEENEEHVFRSTLCSPLQHLRQEKVLWWKWPYAEERYAFTGLTNGQKNKTKNSKLGCEEFNFLRAITISSLSSVANLVYSHRLCSPVQPHLINIHPIISFSCLVSHSSFTQLTQSPFILSVRLYLYTARVFIRHLVVCQLFPLHYHVNIIPCHSALPRALISATTTTTKKL